MIFIVFDGPKTATVAIIATSLHYLSLLSICTSLFISWRSVLVFTKNILIINKQMFFVAAQRCNCACCKKVKVTPTANRQLLTANRTTENTPRYSLFLSKRL